MQSCPYCGYTQNRDNATFCANCGAGLPGLGTGKLPSNTTVHGRYAIVQRVGQGGGGAVYQVADLHISGRMWALKEMSGAVLSNQADRAQAVVAFQREGQLLATLRHPNLPRVIDFFSEGGRYYLVMDFVEGETLDQLLTRHGPLSEMQVLDWADQLCDVLDYLHHQVPPVIFRDMKPGNVMVDGQGHIKLIDFGIARLFKPGQRSDTQVVGTPGFAPPEQYGRGQTDARSDVYSLGVTLHQLLTGHDPAQTPFQLPLVRQINPAVSVGAEQTIQQATATDPNDRFPSIAAMRQALCAQPPTPFPVSPPPSLPIPRHIRPRTVVIMAVMLSLAGFLGMRVLICYPPVSPTPTSPVLVTPLPTATTVPPAISPTATRDPTATPTTPPPSRTPSPTPTLPSSTTLPSDEAAIQAIIRRYVDLKDQAVGHWQTEELDTVLRGDALQRQLESVQWLQKYDAHWELELHSMTFDQMEHIDDHHMRVLVTKIETGRYYHLGSTTPSTKQSYYSKRYQVWYDLELLDGQWYIVNIDL